MLARHSIIGVLVASSIACTPASRRIDRVLDVIHAPTASHFRVEHAAVDETVAPSVRKAIEHALLRTSRWGSLRTPVVIRIYPGHDELIEAVGAHDYAWLRAWARYDEILLQSPRTWGIDYSKQLPELVTHELTHVVMYQRAASADAWDKQEIPLWFREGMASVTAEQGYRRGRPDEIGAYLRANPDVDPLRPDEALLSEQKDLVYNSGHWAFDFLVRSAGTESVGTLLDTLRGGASFEAAFLQTFGFGVKDFLIRWRVTITGEPVVAASPAQRAPAPAPGSGGDGSGPAPIPAPPPEAAPAGAPTHAPPADPDDLPTIDAVPIDAEMEAPPAAAPVPRPSPTRPLLGTLKGPGCGPAVELRAMTVASLGSPTDGSLLGGIPLPDHPGVLLLKPSIFATFETGAYLLSAVEQVRRAHPGSHPLPVGSASAKGGGRLRPHKSHRSGRDVDIGYYQRSPGSRVRWAKMDARNLDVARTWTLFERLIASGRVQFLFVDYRLQRLLHAEASRNGASKRALARYFQYPKGRRHRSGIIRHERGHADHFHVRFRCPLRDSGCTG